MGCKVITTNCVDTNKGDTSRPNYRSRLVGREVKYDKRLDLFSAAPPLETLKFMCSMYARGQTCPEPCRLAVIDIKRAYFNALARRPIFIEIPQNGLEPGTTVVSSCAKCNDGIFFFLAQFKKVN